MELKDIKTKEQVKEYFSNFEERINNIRGDVDLYSTLDFVFENSVENDILNPMKRDFILLTLFLSKFGNFRTEELEMLIRLYGTFRAVCIIKAELKLYKKYYDLFLEYSFYFNEYYKSRTSVSKIITDNMKELLAKAESALSKIDDLDFDELFTKIAKVKGELE